SVDDVVCIFFLFFDMFFLFFFFFSSRRRHTRSYGDWSSDVCSSDLFRAVNPKSARNSLVSRIPVGKGLVLLKKVVARSSEALPRSEERRVGKECRARWWRYY